MTSRSRAGSSHTWQRGWSESPKHSAQRPTRSFISSRDSASAMTCSRGRLSRLNASRDAVFSPIPGSRESSLTNRVIAGGRPSLRLRFSAIPSPHVSVGAETGQLDSAQRSHLPRLLCDDFLGAFEGQIYRHHDQVLQHRFVVRGQERRIDFDLAHLHRSVHARAHHSTAGVGTDYLGRGLLLHFFELFLKGLCLFHQRAEIKFCQWDTPLRKLSYPAPCCLAKDALRPAVLQRRRRFAASRGPSKSPRARPPRSCWS